jgi:L-asparaginase
VKILVVALGGTIGSVKTDSIDLDSNNLKVTQYCERKDIEFVGVSLFNVLSENMSVALWKKLVAYLENVNFDEYSGVIILHGSDTLAFTSALIANAFPNKKIILVASDKPIEDETSNGIANFNNAVDTIVENDSFDVALVSYNGIHKASCITSANIKDEFVSLDSSLPPLDCRKIYENNILIVNPYVEIDFSNYNLDNLDAVIIAMYHSATVPEGAKEFAKTLKNKGIVHYFVTHKSSADYVTAQDIDNIIFGCTIENAYARLMLTNLN